MGFGTRCYLLTEDRGGERAQSCGSIFPTVPLTHTPTHKHSQKRATEQFVRGLLTPEEASGQVGSSPGLAKSATEDHPIAIYL